MLRRLTAILLAAAVLGGATAAHARPDAIDSAGGPTLDAILAGAVKATAPTQNASLFGAATSGWQCAQFARLFSGIQIFGDAATWWTQAIGRYGRGLTPQAGSVLVFRPYGPMTRGHVAVVSQVLTDRIIQVTHANWSPIAGVQGRVERGHVEKDVTVVDVSSAGDWSQVKVWYDPTRDLGRTIYPTYGFVYRAAQAAGLAAGMAAGQATQAAATRVADAFKSGGAFAR